MCMNFQSLISSGQDYRENVLKGSLDYLLLIADPPNRHTPCLLFTDICIAEMFYEVGGPNRWMHTDLNIYSDINISEKVWRQIWK